VAGFVVCASCGTQIKAGRAYCLRCGEDLPVEGVAVETPIWESLGLSRPKLLMLLAVAALIALTLVIVIWTTDTVSPDEFAVPATAPAAPRAVPPPAAGSVAPADLPHRLS
jgi:hypothetical protein